MNRPEVKLLAVSNVYCRLMNFLKKGDQEFGHYHSYDHGTLLATGKLLVEKFDENGILSSSKEFTAPSFIFIEKGSKHLLTALEDNTVASCIHALRTIEETIIDPDFFVEQKEFRGDGVNSDENLPRMTEFMAEKGINYLPIAVGRDFFKK